MVIGTSTRRVTDRILQINRLPQTWTVPDFSARISAKQVPLPLIQFEEFVGINQTDFPIAEADESDVVHLAPFPRAELTASTSPTAAAETSAGVAVPRFNCAVFTA